LTPIVTKISFAPFSARRGPPTPKRGEDTSGTRVRLHANFGVIGPRVVEKSLTEQTKKTSASVELTQTRHSHSKQLFHGKQISQGFYR